MAGASFGTGGFNAVAGMPRPSKGPAVPAPWRAGSGTMLGRNIPQASFTQTSATAAPAHPQIAPQPTPPKASATTTTPAQSPLDSTYYQQIAAHQLRLGNQVNGLTAQSQNANTGLQSALAQLAYQQPRDSLRLEQGANRRGALYSSAYTQDLGNLGNTYLNRQTAATTANTQKQAGIAAQIAALNQAEPITEAGDYDAAVARAVKAALANPATGQAPAVTPPASPSAPSASPPGRPGTTGAGLSGLRAAKPPAYKVGQGIQKVKSGFGYRGGF